MRIQNYGYSELVSLCWETFLAEASRLHRSLSLGMAPSVRRVRYAAIITAPSGFALGECAIMTSGCHSGDAANADPCFPTYVSLHMPQG